MSQGLSSVLTGREKTSGIFSGDPEIFSGLRSAVSEAAQGELSFEPSPKFFDFDFGPVGAKLAFPLVLLGRAGTSKFFPGLPEFFSGLREIFPGFFWGPFISGANIPALGGEFNFFPVEMVGAALFWVCDLRPACPIFPAEPLRTKNSGLVPFESSR